MTMSTEETGTRIGWIGTGVMGAAMCAHLMNAGYPASIYTRTREKAADLEAQGAVWRESPAEVAANSDITFAIVGFPSDVRDVFLGPEGALAEAAAGDLLVDMTTSEPSLAIEINREARTKDVATIDAPVSGGDVGARNGTLSIMVGGHDDDVARVRPFLEILGSNIVHVGGPGAGQHSKMVNQILIASGMIGVCEALLYAQEAGLDTAKAFQAVSGGAAGSWSLSNYGPRMLRGDFDPGFYIDHFVKDMGIALDEASKMQVAVPGLALARQLYIALQAQGGGRSGIQALILALAKLSAVEWEGGIEID
jgi:3-hydroxyisobutyrate dehydrogenase